MHLDDGHIPEVADIRDSNVHVRLQGSKVAAETVTGSGRLEPSRRMSSSRWHRCRAKRAASAPSMTR